MKIKPIINLLIFIFFSFNLYSYKITQKDLKYVMPAATHFSIKENKIPVWKSFKGTKLIGVCFLTTDILPNLSNIYGPVKILVGLDKTGKISGIKILYLPKKLPEQKKIATPFFEIQFIGKNIEDKFAVGKDINSVPGATVTIKTISLFIKKSAAIVYNKYFKQYKNFSKKRKISSIFKKKKTISKKQKIKSSGLNLYYVLIIFGLIFLVYILKFFYKRSKFFT